jgi:hypothetical protein
MRITVPPVEFFLEMEMRLLQCNSLDTTVEWEIDIAR